MFALIFAEYCLPKIEEKRSTFTYNVLSHNMIKDDYVQVIAQLGGLCDI